MCVCARVEGRGGGGAECVVRSRRRAGGVIAFKGMSFHKTHMFGLRATTVMLLRAARYLVQRQTCASVHTHTHAIAPTSIAKIDHCPFVYVEQCRHAHETS